MAKPTPTYLKLHADLPDVVRPDVEDFPGLAELCDAFSDATGWPLEFVSDPETCQKSDLTWSAPVNPGVGAAPGRLRMDFGKSDEPDAPPRIGLAPAQRLTVAVADLLGHLYLARQTVWCREAELAAGVPVAAHADEPAQLARRLENILRTGAEAIDCQAAALYMLDEGTTELKLRSSWGLPLERLIQPARPLQGAVADLEALLGHAVALEQASSMESWRVPEECGSALCVPVCSPTIPLGTLWFFSDRPCTFSPVQTHLAEILAGRLAAELERTMLLIEQMQNVDLKRQYDAARRLQQSQLPPTSRLGNGWDVAGWTAPARQVGGTFHDWFTLADDRLVIALGDAGHGGLEGALTASALRAALRAECRRPLSPQAELPQTLLPNELLERLNRSMWTSGCGDQFASMFLAIADPRTGKLDFSSAGRPTALWLTNDRDNRPLERTEPLGTEPDTEYALESRQLTPGEALIVYSRGIREAADERGRPLDEAALARILSAHRKGSAEQLLDVVRDRAEAHGVNAAAFDRTVLIARRQ